MFVFYGVFFHIVLPLRKTFPVFKEGSSETHPIKIQAINMPLGAGKNRVAAKTHEDAGFIFSLDLVGRMQYFSNICIVSPVLERRCEYLCGPVGLASLWPEIVSAFHVYGLNDNRLILKSRKECLESRRSHSNGRRSDQGSGSRGHGN